MDKVEQLRRVAGGANIHTANKCWYYFDKWTDEGRSRDLAKMDVAIDKAFLGDWKPLLSLLRGRW